MSLASCTGNVNVICFLFFEKKSNLIFCSNINGLLTTLNLKNHPTEWRLFIGSSKLNLKVALLHNSNRLVYISISHAVHMKETYANMAALLDSIKYVKQKWKICGDLKAIAILLDMQFEYTK